MKTIQETIEAIRYRMERDAQWDIDNAMSSLKAAIRNQMNLEERIAEKVARTIKNRSVLPAIKDAIAEAEAESLAYASVYYDGHDIDVKLDAGADYGKILVQIRKALGAPLVQIYKEIHDENPELIKVSLKCDEYPGLFVSYIRPYQGGNKCRIVERVVRSLECDAS